MQTASVVANERIVSAVRVRSKAIRFSSCAALGERGASEQVRLPSARTSATGSAGQDVVPQASRGARTTSGGCACTTTNSPTVAAKGLQSQMMLESRSSITDGGWRAMGPEVRTLRKAVYSAYALEKGRLFGLRTPPTITPTADMKPLDLWWSASLNRSLTTTRPQGPEGWDVNPARGSTSCAGQRNETFRYMYRKRRNQARAGRNEKAGRPRRWVVERTNSWHNNGRSFARPRRHSRAARHLDGRDRRPRRRDKRSALQRFAKEREQREASRVRRRTRWAHLAPCGFSPCFRAS